MFILLAALAAAVAAPEVEPAEDPMLAGLAGLAGPLGRLDMGFCPLVEEQEEPVSKELMVRRAFFGHKLVYVYMHSRGVETLVGNVAVLVSG